jgi:hypothetical protein
MLFDAQNLFSDGQEVTATAPSTNVIDTGGADKGGPEELYLALVADVTHTAAGAATLTVTVQTDDAEGFGSAETLVASKAFALADLAAGKVVWSVAIPRGAKRYLRLNYTVATGPFTAGALTAGLVKDVAAFKDYASGYTVGA